MAGQRVRRRYPALLGGHYGQMRQDRGVVYGFVLRVKCFDAELKLTHCILVVEIVVRHVFIAR